MEPEKTEDKNFPVNTQGSEINKRAWEEGHSEQALSAALLASESLIDDFDHGATGSLPVSIPAPRSQSPVGWESPAGRLSTSAFTPTAPNDWPSFSSLTGKDRGVSSALSTPIAVPDAAPGEGESDRIKELKSTAHRAVSKVLKLHASKDGWTMICTSPSGLMVHRRANDPLIIRAEKVIEGFGSGEIFAVLKTLGCRRIWDNLIEHEGQLEYCGEGVSVSYLTMKGFFPISRRDFVTVASDKIIADGSSRTIATAATSISESLLSVAGLNKIPTESSSANVRGVMKIVGWILDPIDPYDSTYSHPIPSTRVTFYHQIDLGGAVPQAVHGFMVGSAYKYPANVEQYLKESGVPPCITSSKSLNSEQGEVYVSRQELLHDKNEFKAEFYYTRKAVKEPCLKDVTGNQVSTDNFDTFHLEIDPVPTGSTDSDCDGMNDNVLLVELLIDVSRYPSGYRLQWTTHSSENASKGDGPQLRVSIEEVAPAPTHSSTHVSMDNENANVARESDSNMARSGDAAVARTLDSTTSKSHAMKHLVKVSSLTGAEQLTSFTGEIFITPGKKSGVAGLWSEGGYTVMVNGVRTHVMTLDDIARDKRKQIVRKRASHPSLSTPRVSAVSVPAGLSRDDEFKDANRLSSSIPSSFAISSRIIRQGKGRGERSFPVTSKKQRPSLRSLFQEDDVSTISRTQWRTNTERLVDDKDRLGHVHASSHSEASARPGTYKISSLLLCGMLTFLLGCIFRISIIDARSSAKLSGHPPATTGLESQCPLLFCPPCPMCSTETVTVTVTAHASATPLAMEEEKSQKGRLDL